MGAHPLLLIVVLYVFVVCSCAFAQTPVITTSSDQNNTTVVVKNGTVASASSQLRFPYCGDLEITKIEFADTLHDTLLVTVFNNCDTCDQHVYTGLRAFGSDDILAVDKYLFSNPSPPNNDEYIYTLIAEKDFEIVDINRILMLFVCDSIRFSGQELFPYNFYLAQNYPNPFNPSTTISYSIPISDFVTLKIYDMLGREIQTLLSEFQEANTYSVNFDASKLSSGIYFYKLKVGNEFVETKKMLLMR